MTPDGPYRLGLVIEDQPDTRAALVAVLHETFPGIDIHAFETLGAARGWIAGHLQAESAAIALVDLALPDGSGIELLHLLAGGYPRVMPVVTTIFDDDAHLFEALAAGAQGYLLKDLDAGVLGRYLRRMRQGEPPLSPSIARRMLGHFRVSSPTAMPAPMLDEVALTKREIEVLQLIGRGLRVGEAAGVLGLADQTVAGYVKSIYRKLQVSSRAEAALEAARRGLV
ncbi:response regulator transcription factor [Zavarzinia aquatilis]|uniref:DNA-binding response regulator n=1 Tax=Zavarzinia aquatilis TaxID=2211142 RepID=A0A317EGJ4_9PROT|nr:response regulator transcription factor [Zavarzinia aquatilis]PWR25979.1 DNA-binding response regulator [Zavarzinia aquatilis]